MRSATVPSADSFGSSTFPISNTPLAPAKTRNLKQTGVIIYLAVVFFLGIGAGTPLFGYRSTIIVDAETDLRQQLVWLAIYAISLVIFLTTCNLTIPQLAQLWPLWLLLIFISLSPLWSINLELSSRRVIALIGTTAIGIAAGGMLNPRQLCLSLGFALIAALLLSIGLAVLRPALGLDDFSTDAWRGAFVQKNSLGRAVALAFLLWLCVPLSGTRKFLRLPIIGGLLFLALKSESATAALIIIGFTVILALSQLFTASSLAGLIATVATALILILATGYVYPRGGLSSIFKLFGRTPTLTGRQELWSSILPSIEDRFILGYGYSAFWDTRMGAGQKLWSQIGFQATHAHNGLLQVLLDLGITGTLLLSIVIGWSIWLAISYHRMTSDRLSLFPILYILFFLSYNITESALLARNSLFWLLIVAFAVSISFRSSNRSDEPFPWMKEPS